MQLIEAKGLKKTFGSTVAVDGVDMSVGRGEVVGFLGPNGAGKSTTMKMISGFLEPDEGSASICGHDIRTDPLQAKRHMGYLPEGAPSYPDMLVADFLAFVGRMRGLRGAILDDRLAEMAERINLAEVWDRRIENLSKGYKRRVGIAQALIHDPDILILDEPTDGLDPNQKHEMRSLIRRISADKAIVVSTHILEEVEAVCTRAMIIASGKVLADETPHDLMARMSGDKAIRLTVASKDADDVVAKVGPFAPAGGVEVLEKFNGSTRLLIKGAGDSEKPAGLASRLQEAGLEIEDFGIYRPSLEDVFRQITRQDRPN